MESHDAATTERWQSWQLQNVQDAVREVASQQAAAEDLEVAYRLQLDEIMMEVESDALCRMFEEDLEDCKLRRAALQVQVRIHARYHVSTPRQNAAIDGNIAALTYPYNMSSQGVAAQR